MIEFPIVFTFNTSVLFEFGNSRYGGSTGDEREANRGDDVTET